MFLANRRAGLLRAARPQAKLSSEAIDRPFGETPLADRSGWKEEKRPRGQRVLDGLLGVCAGGRVTAVSRASETALFENDI